MPAHGSRPSGRWPGPIGISSWLALLAIGLLLLGTLVYLADRPAGSAWLVPSSWQLDGSARPWFGAMGAWLPSFVHALAFSVLTALCLPRTRPALAGSCLAWAAIDTLAEVGQHAMVSGRLADGLARLLGEGPMASQIGRYFTRGVFDPADVAAGLAGAALAYLVLRATLLPNRASAPPAP